MCYTSLPKMGQREAEKRDKYAPLLGRLETAGYAPELRGIALLGTTGEITNSASKTLTQAVWDEGCAT
jgi:hypothetical protein